MTKKIILLLLIAMNLSCKSSKDTNIVDECDQIDIICTEQFVTISVQVFDENDNAILLDDFKVIRKDTGEDITNKNGHQQIQYPILNDSYQKELANKELTITFKGYLDNLEVINHDYVVSADCCHIHLVSGNTKINL